MIVSFDCDLSLIGEDYEHSEGRQLIVFYSDLEGVSTKIPSTLCLARIYCNLFGIVINYLLNYQRTRCFIRFHHGSLMQKMPYY